MATGLLFSVFGVGTDKDVGTEVLGDDSTERTYKVYLQNVPKDDAFSNEPRNNHVDNVIRMAKVSAALTNYRKFALASRQADSSVMEVFWKIEAVSSVGQQTQELYSSLKDHLKELNFRSVESELIELAEPKSISALANHDYENRNKKQEIEAKLNAIEYSVSVDANEVSSTRDIMLVSSALLWEVGELMEQAVSANGIILNEVSYQKAASLIEATKAVKLASNHPYCDREIATSSNVRNGVEALELKFKERTDKNLSLINADDVYAVADAAFQMGTENTYASSCSEMLYVSQSH